MATTTFTLAANVENLVLGGTGVLSGTGNDLDNQITGNSAANTLDGKAGNDTMTGGAGNDIYVVDASGDVVVELAGGGTDTVRSSVTHALGDNVENLTLTGTAAADGTGNALDNLLAGNTGANVLAGGLGNDTYAVSLGDTVVEQVGGGIDMVRASVSWTLGANTENLTLVAGLAATGNALANQITGNDNNNTLDGKAGADTLAGGLGNDTYLVDNAGDVVVENSGEGSDTVNSSVTFALGAELENLTLTGAGAINGTGNALDNVLSGNSGANLLAGGLGNDTYVVGAGDSVVEQADAGLDTVLSGLTWTLADNVENLTLTGVAGISGTGNASNNAITGTRAANTLDGKAGADTMTGGLGNDIYVVDAAADVVTELAGEGTDTVQSSVSWILGANLENLTLLGASSIDATGNELVNVIVGNAGANVLDGGAGNDTLRGAAGDDTYQIDSVGDVVVENAGEGIDSVTSGVTTTLSANVENLTLTGTADLKGTGNALGNHIAGNSGANVLDGKAGADVLAGGLGDDTYVVDSAGDTVTENAGEGIDAVQSSVSWSLSDNVENLTLTGAAAISGTGNALANVITGNAAANVLAGGAGDDTYFVTSVDTIVEGLGGGIDTAVATTTLTLAANVENLVLGGTGVLSGTGNDLGNQITGNSAANTLDGKAGNDTMAGGAGNDIYVVDAAGDVVVELAGGGTDTVRSSVTHALGDNVENLTLTGAAALNGTGNALDNVLAGNTGANVLAGGLGNDTYTVGLGDTVVEQVGGGIDTVQSTVSWTLGANTENLLLVAGLVATGNALDNLITGNASNNTLDGQGGNDLLQGLAGNDLLRDTAGNSAMDGGSGIDILRANGGNAFLAGGAGNDSIETGAANAQIIAFNAGDGLDTVVGSGPQNDILSLGKVSFADLHFTRAANDLTVSTGVGQGLVLKDWFAGQQTVATLQMVIDGTPDYDPAAADALHNSKVVAFDFAALAAQFTQQGAPSDWAAQPALAGALVSGSNTAAMGGDLAMIYAHDGALGAAAPVVLGLIGVPEFGLVPQDFGA